MPGHLVRTSLIIIIRGVTLQCLDHILTGRVVRYTVLIECASSLNIPLASGDRPSRFLTLFGRVRFIAWRLRHPANGNANRTRAFLGLPDASGLQPCDRTHQKIGLVPHSYACRAYDKYSAPSHFTLRSAVLGVHGSGRVCPGCGGSRSRCALTGILEPQGAVPKSLTLLERDWVYRLVPAETLFKGMPTGTETFLELPSASGQWPCAGP